MATGSITALTLSAVQYQALDGGVAANVPEHIRLIEDAESHGARLVIFPELSLTGYRLDLLDGPGEWLSAADRRLDGIREICRRTGITAVVGAAFKDADGTPRLAALAVHPTGSIETSFKTHLHGPEQDLFVAGSNPAVLEIDGWKVALAICFDAARPGHAEWAADAGRGHLCRLGPLHGRRRPPAGTASRRPRHGQPDVLRPGEPGGRHAARPFVLA